MIIFCFYFLGGGYSHLFLFIYLIIFPGVGIFALLDEECAFPRATDVSFVDKINKQFDHNEFYRKVVKSRGFPTFG